MRVEATDSRCRSRSFLSLVYHARAVPRKKMLLATCLGGMTKPEARANEERSRVMRAKVGVFCATVTVRDHFACGATNTPAQAWSFVACINFPRSEIGNERANHHVPLSIRKP